MVSAHDRRRGLLWGLVGVVALSLTLPATRFAVVWLDPVFVGLGRALVAAVGQLQLLRPGGRLAGATFGYTRPTN